MLYYMDSKVFNKVFLNNESDKDILDCQYVLISYRIRSGNSRKNVVCYNSLYPDSNILAMSENMDSFRELYYDQIKKFKSIIAILIKGSIEEKYNIIFMCSKKENKIGYLKILSDYIYETFGYPVYDYLDYVECRCEMLDFDKEKVLKKCKKYIKKDKYKSMPDDKLVDMIRKHPHKLEKILRKQYNYDISLEDIGEEEMYTIITHLREFFYQ